MLKVKLSAQRVKSIRKGKKKDLKKKQLVLYFLNIDKAFKMFVL